MIEEVVGMMLDSEEVARLLSKEKIERWRKILNETCGRDTWKEDMKKEARKFKRELVYYSKTDIDSEEEAAEKAAARNAATAAEKDVVKAIVAAVIKEAIEADIEEAAGEAVEAV